MVKLSLVTCCNGRDLRSNDETGTAKDTRGAEPNSNGSA
nr:MAG TPA: hypothetical protein [Bacteriophage sp.]